MDAVRSEMVLSWLQRKEVSYGSFDRGFQLGNKMSYQSIGLPDLVWSLLETPLRRIDSAIALVNVLLQVAHVVVLEAVLVLFSV